MHELTDHQLYHLHDALTAHKRNATSGGRVWRAHQTNAELRTLIETELTHRNAQ